MPATAHAPRGIEHASGPAGKALDSDLPAALSSPAVAEAASFVDAWVDWTTAHRCPPLARARLSRAEDPADVVTVVAPQLHTLIIGETHEPALVASGHFKLLGPTAPCLRLLSALQPISATYRAITGSATRDPQRFQALPIARVMEWAPVISSWRPALDDTPEDAAFLAAIILALLPPACREIEVPEVVRVTSRGQISPGRFSLLVDTLLDLAAAPKRLRRLPREHLLAAALSAAVPREVHLAARPLIELCGLLELRIRATLHQDRALDAWPPRRGASTGPQEATWLPRSA